MKRFRLFALKLGSLSNTEVDPTRLFFYRS